MPSLALLMVERPPSAPRPPRHPLQAFIAGQKWGAYLVGQFQVERIVRGEAGLDGTQQGRWEEIPMSDDPYGHAQDIVDELFTLLDVQQAATDQLAHYLFSSRSRATTSGISRPASFLRHRSVVAPKLER